MHVFMSIFEVLRLQARSGSSNTGEGPAERALRALLLHVEAGAAYKAALGLYDLPLAFMVVNHAQVSEFMCHSTFFCKTS